MRAGAQVGRCIVAHGAKAGQRGLQADAQIPQKSLHKDGRGDEHGNGNKDGAERVGNQVVKQNRCGRGTNGLGGKNEFLLLQAQDLAAHNTGHIHPVHAAQGNNDALDRHPAPA